MKLLVSVRSEEEALIAARGGADFIDLKEPRAGALGGLPVETIARIVRRIRLDTTLPISATIGDLGMDEIESIAAAVDAVAACGVDYVKVGIARGAGAAEVLSRLARCGHAVVPVFIADAGLDEVLVAQACAEPGFPALMADTADKRAGSLFDCCATADLARFVARVRRADKLVGLAGALRLADLPALQDLAPDFAGFRSAVCAPGPQGRGGDLRPGRLALLRDALKQSVRLCAVIGE